jgi:hypothetical protein
MILLLLFTDLKGYRDNIGDSVISTRSIGVESIDWVEVAEWSRGISDATPISGLPIGFGRWPHPLLPRRDTQHASP